MVLCWRFSWRHDKVRPLFRGGRRPCTSHRYRAVDAQGIVRQVHALVGCFAMTGKLFTPAFVPPPSGQGKCGPSLRVFEKTRCELWSSAKVSLENISRRLPHPVRSSSRSDDSPARRQVMDVFGVVSEATLAKEQADDGRVCDPSLRFRHHNVHARGVKYFQEENAHQQRHLHGWTFPQHRPHLPTSSFCYSRFTCRKGTRTQEPFRVLRAVPFTPHSSTVCLVGRFLGCL